LLIYYKMIVVVDGDDLMVR